MSDTEAGLDRLERRARLAVGTRFLVLRPRVAALGALGTGALWALGDASPLQKLGVASALGATVLAFFIEAWALARRSLSERWLRTSLGATVLALGVGAALSGGLESPFVPLLFAPVVVGLAAFSRSPTSAVLLALAGAVVLTLGALAPLPGFPAPSAPWAARMVVVTIAVSLALLAVGVVGLVDAQRELARELERLRGAALEAAERRASSLELLGAKAAHDVKNPLAAARGLVELVRRRADDERDRSRLDVVVGEVDRALSVLEGYLTFARPLAPLAARAVRAVELVEDVAGVIEARAVERGVVVSVAPDASPGARAWLDRERVRDALLNLALNAVRAMPRGGTLLLAATTSPEAVTFEVRDDGVGMSEAELAALGRPFVSHSEGGHGLGVALARGVAEQHGGTLSFESAPGRGTRALLRLPTRRDHG
jgi:two-component system sensor histidine kinase HydH